MLKVPLEMPVPAAVPSVQIIRAVLREYHAATHTAEVEPVLGPASLVGEIPVLMSCLPALLAPGRDVAVLTWSDVGGLVLGPYGGVPPQALWGDGSDGAISNLTDTDTQATTIEQTDPALLTHNRTIRATGNVTLSRATLVYKQDGQPRGSFPVTHGGPGILLGAILAALGSKGIPSPIRPGGGTASLCGGVLQILSGATVAIGGTITAQGANAASDGGGGGGLVVVIARTAISGASAMDVSAANGHATANAKGGAGSYSGAPGGHAGYGGSGGGTGGYCTSGAAASGGAGYVAGKAGGHIRNCSGGSGGGTIEEAGQPAPTSPWNNGGRGGNNVFSAVSRIDLSRSYDPTAATAGGNASGTGGAAGTNGGGGGGGAQKYGATNAGPGGNGGNCGSGGGGGGDGAAGGTGAAGGNGGAGNPNLYPLSALSLHRGRAGGQGGGGGGGGGYSAATSPAGGTGGTGASGLTGSNGAGNGSAGANGSAGSTGGGSGGLGGAGGAGGNGGGAAGLVLLIAPTITYSGTVTGRLVKIDGADALDFIRGYYVD